MFPASECRRCFTLSPQRHGLTCSIQTDGNGVSQPELSKYPGKVPPPTLYFAGNRDITLINRIYSLQHSNPHSRPEPNPAQSSLPFVIPPAPVRRGSVADLSRRAVEGPAVSLDPTIMMGPMADVGGLWRIGRLGRNFHPRHPAGNLRPNRWSRRRGRRLNIAQPGRAVVSMEENLTRLNPHSPLSSRA